jgi:hypothetical protein
MPRAERNPRERKFQVAASGSAAAFLRSADVPVGWLGGVLAAVGRSRKSIMLGSELRFLFRKRKAKV